MAIKFDMKVKKKRKDLAEDFLNMADNSQMQFQRTKTLEHNHVSDQIKNALSGEDFTLHIDGEDYSGLKGHSEDEVNKIIGYLLKELGRAGSQEEYDKIKKLVQLFYAELEETQEEPQVVEADKKTSKSSNSNKSLTEQQLKDNDRSEYAKQKLTGKSQTIQPTIDTSKFDGLSQEELMACFKPDYFYSLSKDEQLSLYQTCTNRYLLSQGVSPCAIVLEDMALNDRTIEFGCYRPNRGAIYLNKNLFDNIFELAGALNPFFPLKLLETVIHEARHRVQFAMFESNPSNAAEREIQLSMMHSQSNMSYAQYLAEADELDARNAALAYMREGAELSGSRDMEEFYCAAKSREMGNPKASTTTTMRDACADIYDERIGREMLDRVNMSAAKRTIEQMMNMLHGQTFGYSTARVKRL
ncbi:MAG: hypothetical protein IJ542_01350 [Clostridia bacterium]|nr:hypothetical protein [Clostridia bacterium]